MNKIILILSLCLGLALMLVGCSGGSSNSTPQTFSIQTNYNATTISSGGSIGIGAFDNQNNPINWSYTTNGPQISLSKTTGQYITLTANGIGTFDVIATDSVTGAKAQLTLTSVSPTLSASITQGSNSVTFNKFQTAKITVNTNASVENIFGSVSNHNIIYLLRDTPLSNYTVFGGNQAGVGSVTFTVQGSNLSQTINFTVPLALSETSLTPTDVQKGTTLQLHATTYPSGGSVTWGSGINSDGTITFNTTGYVTAQVSDTHGNTAEAIFLVQ